MFLYTGDTHGNTDKIVNYIRTHTMSKGDVIVILGDAGFNYYGYGKSMQHDRFVKEAIKRLNITLFCIHGNHEMRPETLPYYKEKTWNGGTVYVEETGHRILPPSGGS